MWIILLFSLFSLPSLLFGATEIPPEAIETGAAADVFVERSRQMKLSENPAWLNLLHYKSTLLGERESQADDSAFFLAQNGAYNAQAELEADLRGFFSRKAAAHPRCLFPARFHWLDRQLNFSDQLPVIECTKFNRWKDKLHANQVTLLFPSMYLENPASMFGHTFLRFDRPDENKLLSYTLSYAASFDETDNVLLYSWKGITGGYSGKFFLGAFFETLQEYSDIEQRDIWEYTLNLNKQEIDQLIRHLWEVSGINFNYYFFRENCSYRLIALLDVARENLNMSIDAHPFYAVPVDTVRDVDQSGLIAQRNYRPSTRNKISFIAEQIGEKAGKTSIALAKNELSIDDVSEQFTEHKQAQIYQLADAMLSQNKKPSTEQQALQLDILSARSYLDVTKHEFEYTADAPELSHLSARWQLSVGEKNIDQPGGQNFYEIGLRPVFHDLLDQQNGFVDGASINILKTKLRWYPQSDRLKLQSLNFFSLQSIVAVKSWAVPTSIKLSFNLKQRDINLDEQVTEFETQFSLGYAMEIKSVLMYALAGAQLEYATEFTNNHAFYLGLDMGVLWPFDNEFISGQTEATYRVLEQVSGQEGNVKQLNIGVQFNVVKDHAVRFEYELIDYEKFESEQMKFSYLQYF